MSDELRGAPIHPGDRGTGEETGEETETRQRALHRSSPQVRERHARIHRLQPQPDRGRGQGAAKDEVQRQALEGEGDQQPREEAAGGLPIGPEGGSNVPQGHGVS